MGKSSLSFAATFVALFALAYVFMAAADALPEPLNTSNSGDMSSPVLTVPVSVGPALRASDDTSPELPVHVSAKKVGLDVAVSNTESVDVDALDALLLKGAVRYPTSAMLGEQGTVLLFGHSSYLPIVHNQNFKAFNGIQKLVAGDTLSVQSATTEYRYAVVSVRLADASEDVVELPATGKHLTLVTCDSFGTKSSRYVVVADYVGAYAL